MAFFLVVVFLVTFFLAVVFLAVVFFAAAFFLGAAFGLSGIIITDFFLPFHPEVPLLILPLFDLISPFPMFVCILICR
ncbi:MAG: hypothetical protein CM15mP107_4720 [Bacteroidota bacterium]|nr:MAG: hypothetical protein CM15mP107_4720 [Bacteroidota bacterium]